MISKFNELEKFKKISIIGWTIIMTSIISTVIYHEYSSIHDKAREEAVNISEKETSFREFTSLHNSVYIENNDNTKNDLIIKNVTTTDNKTLSLLSPSFMLADLLNSSKGPYDNKVHMVSTFSSNPLNRTDSWESKNLLEAAFDNKPREITGNINGIDIYRYFLPVIADKSCLKCHANQGFVEGDIIGGISIEIPLEPIFNKSFIHTKKAISILTLAYFIGLLFIILGIRKIKEQYNVNIEAFESQILTMVNIIEKRDTYTGGHSKRVAEYSRLIAQHLGLSDNDIDKLMKAALLHDIGKIAIPDSLLLKPGKLTKLEKSLITEHTNIGFELLNKNDSLKGIDNIVKYHHEKIDGSGYPYGLKGSEIPFLSKILTVADTFDAMTTNRIYKASKTVDFTLQELAQLAGKDYDRQIVVAARECLADIKIDDGNFSKLELPKLEEERFAYFYKDQLTHAYNKDYLEFLLFAKHLHKINYNYVTVLELHNFSKFNNNYGWSAGDKILKKLVDSLTINDMVFRIHGDNFIVVNEENIELDLLKPIIEFILSETEITYSLKNFKIDTSKINSFEALQLLIGQD